jgi:hypothetical protein
VTEDERLCRELVGAGRADGSAGAVDELVVLGVRARVRRVLFETAGATDCRRLTAEAFEGVLGGTTLEGRARCVGALGRVVVVDWVGGGAAVLDGGGSASDIMDVMLESRMKSPWPGAQEK